MAGMTLRSITRPAATHGIARARLPAVPAPALTPPMQPLRTYIVEDSQLIREALVATLEELVPVEVVGTAEDESTAVQWLQQPGHVIDLLIVDIFLKGGSGLGVLRAVSGLADGPATVVVLSNFATPDMRRRCIELGADRVFDKSHDIEALILFCARLAAGDSEPAPLPA